MCINFKKIKIMENLECKTLNENEVDEVFMSQLIDEDELHRFGLSISSNEGGLLAENKDFGGA